MRVAEHLYCGCISTFHTDGMFHSFAKIAQIILATANSSLHDSQGELSPQCCYRPNTVKDMDGKWKKKSKDKRKFTTDMFAAVISYRQMTKRFVAIASRIAMVFPTFFCHCNSFQAEKNVSKVKPYRKCDVRRTETKRPKTEIQLRCVWNNTEKLHVDNESKIQLTNRKTWIMTKEESGFKCAVISSALSLVSPNQGWLFWSKCERKETRLNDEQIKNVFETKTKGSLVHHKKTNLHQSFESMKESFVGIINRFSFNLNFLLEI